MELNEIAKKLDFVTHSYMSETFIFSKDAPALIGYLAEKEQQIFGFEVFKMEGGKLVPDIDLIADFSSCKTWLESVHSAEAFLKHIPKQDDIYLSVTL